MSLTTQHILSQAGITATVHDTRTYRFTFPDNSCRLGGRELLVEIVLSLQS